MTALNSDLITSFWVLLKAYQPKEVADTSFAKSLIESWLIILGSSQADVSRGLVAKQEDAGDRFSTSSKVLLRRNGLIAEMLFLILN